MIKTDFGRRFFADHVHEMLSNVKLKPNVREILLRLHEEGNELVFITARSNTYLGDSYSFTKDYLDRNNVYYDKLFTCEEDKLKRCIEEGIDIMIDDSVRTCNRVQEGGIKSLVFNSRCNLEYETTCDRVDSWDQIYDYIHNQSVKL
jgi:uncharacterized HAD superfamily protein